MGFFGMQKVDTPSEVPAISQEEPVSAPAPARAGSTIIAQGVTFSGTLQGEGVVQVEGVVEGEFDMVGAVIVAESGLIRGPVAADVVRVAGRIEGNVQAREHMRLESSGSLDGDVKTASLVVETVHHREGPARPGARAGQGPQGQRPGIRPGVRAGRGELRERPGKTGLHRH